MKPKPVVVKTICSECDLPWEDHGENPTTSDCIRLLKSAATQRPSCGCYDIHPYRYYIYPYQWWPQLQTTWTTGGTRYLSTTSRYTVQTPAIETTCTAVSA